MSKVTTVVGFPAACSFVEELATRSARYGTSTCSEDFRAASTPGTGRAIFSRQGVLIGLATMMERFQCKNTLVQIVDGVLC